MPRLDPADPAAAADPAELGEVSASCARQVAPQAPWTPTRDEGLRRLRAFLPRAGRRYAETRNHDLGPEDRSNVSTLSPFLRGRLVTEAEVVGAVLERFSLGAAEKFVQEVCWRTYWKGWLEHRPGVWEAYLADVRRLEGEAEGDTALARDLARAREGRTGIEAFDAWARELEEIGWLHNHARMWFASIWIHTLRLPWQLGADHFLTRLLDGDPASNTLSWRWVAGLHTPGKTYLARADNIATYTLGRFRPQPGELAARPADLPLDGPSGRWPLRSPPPVPEGAVALLVTDEDLHPESLDLGAGRVREILAAETAGAWPALAPAPLAFRRGALADARARAERRFGVEARLVPAGAPLAEALRGLSSRALVSGEMAVGPTRAAVLEALEQAGAGAPELVEVRRPWDAAFHPFASAGFFRLKSEIPRVLARLGGA